MHCPADDIGAVVSDIGTYAVRIGFAGDDIPRAFFPTCVGYIDHEHGVVASSTSSSAQPPMETDQKGSPTISFELGKFQPHMQIRNPVTDGIMTDWDVIQKIWEHTMRTYMSVEFKDTPVLLSEKPYNPPANRHKYCEMMFETFGVPALFMSKDAPLCAFACGRTTAMIVDVGYSGTTVTPVHDGWCEVKASNRAGVGGRAFDEYYLHLLESQGVQIRPLYSLNKVVKEDGSIIVTTKNLHNVHPSFDQYHRLACVRDLRECHGRVTDTPFLESESRFANIPTVPYELPDGFIVEAGIDRFKVPEMLFDPTPLVQLGILKDTRTHSLELYTRTHHEEFDGVDDLSGPPNTNGVPFSIDSVPRLVCDSIVRVDAELTQSMLANLVIAGGASCVEGTPDRIKSETERLIHTYSPGWKVKSLAPGTNERAVCAWLGGSILASLGQFHEMWMSKAEYSEYGPRLIDRKCP